MAGTQADALPFYVRRVTGSSDALPQTQRLPEKASLTIKRGTPVVLSSGYIIERTAIDGVTKVVAGIINEPAHTLAADGTAPVGGSGLDYGDVANQPNAKNIPVGAPMADGKIEVTLANDTTRFIGKTDDAHTVGVADVGSIFGLTKDTASGQWFVDCTITSAAAGACVEVTDIIDVGVVGGKVEFKFTRAYQQLFT